MWYLATIHDDRTVSFDTSEGNPLLRRALQQAIQMRHEIEVGRDAIFRLSSATARDSEPPAVPVAAAKGPDAGEEVDFRPAAKPPTPAGFRTTSAVNAEEACRHYITALKERPQNKETAFAEAIEALKSSGHLSRKAFDRAWREGADRMAKSWVSPQVPVGIEIATPKSNPIRDFRKSRPYLFQSASSI